MVPGGGILPERSPESLCRQSQAAQLAVQPSLIRFFFFLFFCALLLIYIADNSYTLCFVVSIHTSYTERPKDSNGSAGHVLDGPYSYDP